MVRYALRIGGFILTALVAACGTPPFKIDVVSSIPGDPILLSPGTKGTSNGLIRIPLPDFELDSYKPTLLRVETDKGTVILTLKMSFGMLYAHVSPLSLEPLASTPALPSALYKASVQGPLPKLRNDREKDAKDKLAMSLAERLPRHTSKLWNDAYNYDHTLRALALVPGMRLRLETMLPVTADYDRDLNRRAQGSTMPPAYLYALPAANGASVVLAPTLEQLAIRSEDECSYDDGCKSWRDASGVHNLLGNVDHRWRFWSIFYPTSLGGVGHPPGALQFVNEERMSKPEDGLPAVLLVGAKTAPDMAKFIEKAKERRRNYKPTMQPLLGIWKDAVRKRKVAADEAGISEADLNTLTDSGKVPNTDSLKAAVAAQMLERSALSRLVEVNDEVGINCDISYAEAIGADCFLLRYRVLPIPEILITVQGAPIWVEIGTTLGMVLAAHETARTTASFAGEEFSAGDAWRNRQNRIPLEQIDFSRVHMGIRARVVALPHLANPDDAIRLITLQAGDEIKWAN